MFNVKTTKNIMEEPKMILRKDCYKLNAKVEHTCVCCGVNIPKKQEYIKQDIYTDGFYDYSNEFCLRCGTEIVKGKSFSEARQTINTSKL